MDRTVRHIVLALCAVWIAALAFLTCGCNGETKSSIALAADVAKEYEGLRLEPYYDGAKYVTIGYGHKLASKLNEPLTRYDPITEVDAVAMLHRDLREAQKEVRRLVKVDLTKGQEAALIDFVFNLGYIAMRDSELLLEVNSGRFDGVPDQLRRWVHAGGVVEKGLVRRREAEIVLWNK